ncbi:prepilin-type N-terminal cleavage/methylation domain-containing protein [Roseateles sp. SL47]|jgi:type IV fimbrial biogenesis protein FimT|uniref:pilus assembly FimT family protein n=1 Tax=Roseateles sp. SL47 TaxID=2995138 RepID=UPI00226F4B2F|nr:prepilin-type N-terminal cleavage/methylation domain-containing protein [Roseateles sp. SL47]WAC73252.1 prepilin-type N-terminal cleavage/methylation domain-containing protein [Roseateles sp. SL47]
MHLSPRPQRGLTLLELMVVIAIIAMISAYAVPGIRSWSNNAQLRTTATNLQVALKQAQGEASRSFRQVVFFRTAATTCNGTEQASSTGTRWVIKMLPIVSTESASATLCGSLNEAAPLVSVTGPQAVCFSGAGRPTALASSVTGVGVACTTGTDSQIIFGISPTTTTSNTKKMQVWMNLGGSVRSCDPTRLSSAAPDGCPAVNQTPTT